MVYNLDLEDLPLNQNDRTFRPRTSTTAAETNFTRKLFTDIKPQIARTNLSNKGEFVKAITFDTGPSNSSPGTTSKEDRRFSTPVRSQPGKLLPLSVSSTLVTKREMLRHQPVLEEGNYDNLLSSEGDNETLLLREDSDTGDFDSKNLHSSLVISNEDVSSGKEEELQEINCTSNYSIKRSMSENASLSMLINTNNRKPSIRSLSPDITKNHRTISPLNQGNSVFTEFFPKPSDAPSPPSINDSPNRLSLVRELTQNNNKGIITIIQ